jgi:hypothetical protein
VAGLDARPRDAESETQRFDDFLVEDFVEDFFEDEAFFVEAFFVPELVFDPEDFLEVDFFDDDFFEGTLPPAARASEMPIAMACFRLVTFLPEPPLFSFPSPYSCITFETLSCAFFPYFVAIVVSSYALVVVQQSGLTGLRIEN